jgi:fused signal recognition particle receptor
MVDSAGRQETNKNLIEELKKMERVLKPDFKIFIGEAFAGKGLLEQAKAFDEALGIDGFILTKIDTDAKGGTVLSLLCELKKPVLFIGTGQGYEDLVPFTPQYIIDRIV